MVLLEFFFHLLDLGLHVVIIFAFCTLYSVIN